MFSCLLKSVLEVIDRKPLGEEVKLEQCNKLLGSSAFSNQPIESVESVNEVAKTCRLLLRELHLSLVLLEAAHERLAEEVDFVAN